MTWVTARAGSSDLPMPTDEGGNPAHGRYMIRARTYLPADDLGAPSGDTEERIAHFSTIRFATGDASPRWVFEGATTLGKRYQIEAWRHLTPQESMGHG